MIWETDFYNSVKYKERKNLFQKVSSRDESKIRELLNQVHQLQARVLDYKAQLDLKDTQIHQLNYENLQLKVQLKKTLQEPSQMQPSHPHAVSTSNQYQDQKFTPNQYVSQVPTFSPGESVNKRQCPICGAIGFNIKEYDDKTRIISYIPRRIYAKKRVCIKCRYEF